MKTVMVTIPTTIVFKQVFNHKMSKIIQKQKGLTLIELMIAMVLGIILAGSVTGLFVTSKQNYRIQESNSRLQENSRFAMFLSPKI